ncbi:hypothetical protein [Cohnella thermotolerans]|uniref:hypothetical protein n=1 Tax=Cohnella thermotolerans TaxID=329858 RepID=UPI000411EF77|nr:hypothetical protein [Cohnella thermotolerans]
MGRDVFKLLLVGGAIAFAVMFGMELASSGINTVYGPVDAASGAASTGRAEEPALSPPATAGRFGSEPPGISLNGTEEAQIPRLDHKPIINKIASGTAEMLQNASRGGIRFIVGLFDKSTN